MNAIGPPGLSDGRAVLDALPIGVALYDGDRRLVLANAGLTRLLGLPRGALRPLSSFAENIRLIAHRGLLGPGEPDAQAHALLELDTGHERRFRRRHPDGRSYDSHHIPMPDGGLLVCLTNTSVLVARVDEAERAVSRVHAAVGCLRMGLAVFTPLGRLDLHNRRFPELLGLAPTVIEPGMGFVQLLQVLHARGEFTGLDPGLLSAHGEAMQLRQQRDNGIVVDVQSDPLPEGGWSLTLTDVTTMVHAEDEAVRRAALLDSILQHLPQGIAVFDADRRLALMNDAYRQIMDGAPGQVGETLDAVVRARLEAGEYLESDPEAYGRRVLGVVAGAPFVRRRLRPNGTTIEVRTEALPQGGDINVITNVTALAAAEGDLARKAALLSSIVDHVPDGIAVYGPDRRLLVVNAAYRTIMAGAEIAIGETIDAIIDRRAQSGEYGPGDPKDRARAQRLHDSTKPQYRRRQRPNGTVIDVRTAPLPDGSLISVVADMTATLAAEAELARRAETLHAMLGHIRHGIILWDRDSRIIAANPVAARMVQCPSDFLTPGRTLSEVVRSTLDRGNLGEGKTARVRAQWLLEQDRSEPHVDQLLTRDGRVLEVRSDPTSQGGFVTTYNDITHVRDAEEALLLAKSAADAANAAKSRFLAAMSNELRTPLSTIIGEAATIARDAADHTMTDRAGAGPGRGINPERTGASAQAIGTAGRTLLGLIDTILDVARLEAGGFDLAEDEVELPQVVHAVLRRFDSAATAAELALVVDLPTHLPRVRADERRLREALGHIVSNAVKFTGPQGSVTIGIRQDWSSGALLIRVTDTGAGIPEEELTRVFGQVGREGDDRPAGAGLGLYISQMLMRAHGGSLTLRSIVGQGTAATLHIPADRVLHDGPRDTN